MSYKEAFPRALEFLQENDDFLILSHVKPDGDTLGSAAALCAALRQFGKRAQIACSDEITPRYRYLSEGFARPEIYFTPKFYITVDIADTALIGSMYEHVIGNVSLAIDHHPSFKQFGEINLCNPSAAACGEIIYSLVTGIGAELTEHIRTALYTAISTDTGCFRYSNTTSTTMCIASELIDGGLDASVLNYKLFMEKSRTRFKVESHIFDNARFFENDTIVFGIITEQLIKELDIKPDDMDDMASLLRCIEGVEAAFLIKESEGMLKISVRSNANINASLLASKLGGGGHRRAAGMRLHCDVDTGIAQILAALKEKSEA